MEKKHTNFFIYFVGFAVNTVSFATGCAFTWTSPILPKLESNEISINPVSRPITTLESALIVSLASLGLFIGPLIPALISGRLGKKNTLLISAAPILVAHIICLFAKSVIMFLVARFLMGLTMGAVWALVPAFVGEICEPGNRGLLGSFLNLMSGAGSLICCSTGPFMSMVWFSVVNLIPILIFYVLMYFFVPESPYDLILIQNNLQKAESSLKSLRRKTDVQVELLEIKLSIEADQERTKGKVMDLFTNSDLLKALIIGAGALTFNALSGINAMLGYTQTIFDLANTSLASEYSTIIVMAIAFFATALNSFLIEKLGRKLLITTSCVLVFFSWAILGLYFFMKDNFSHIRMPDILPLFCVILFFVGYYFGLSSIPYILVGEIFPSNNKMSAVNFCAFVNFFLKFATTLCFPYLIEGIGIAYTFWILAIFMVLGAIFCIIKVPETKGRSLQEINTMLYNRK